MTDLTCGVQTRASKVYSRRILIAMALYAVTLFSVEYALKRLHPAMGTTVALAVLPALPVVSVLVIIGLYLRDERDEFQRELTVQTLVWGMGGMLAVTTVYGFVEQFAHVPHFPAYWAFILFWLFTGLARVAYSRMYPVSGEDEPGDRP